MITVLYWIYKNRAIVGYVLLAVALIVGAFYMWVHFHPPNPALFESQQQASTPVGVEQAANVAEVPISPAQASAIANAIKDDADKPPDAVVQTTGAMLENTIKTELKKSGAQFAIVTDPKNTDSVPTVGKTVTAPGNVGTIPPNTSVTLNQYNIKAYPDRLIQIGGSYQEVMAAYSWKVTVPKIPLIAPHGDVGYLGIYGHANLDQPGMSRVGVMLTIPK